MLPLIAKVQTGLTSEANYGVQVGESLASLDNAAVASIAHVCCERDVYKLQKIILCAAQSSNLSINSHVSTYVH